MLISQYLRNCRPLPVAAAMLIVALSPGTAAAALGEPESSIQSDGAKMQGSIKVQQRTVYRIHEIQLPSGTTVREYVGLDGKVFAVAWNGPVVPDLRQALGVYFDRLVAAAPLQSTGHSHAEMQQDDVVFQARGHMRAFSGRAYLRSAVPAGVNVEDLH